VSGKRRKESSGLLLFRRRGSAVEVLLGHPGGPFWRRRDEGAWTIPKGGSDEGEDALKAARREFEEETGYLPPGDAISLGSSRQPGGKLVHVWAVEDDWSPDELRSNTFALEWPPRSGEVRDFPELDRAAWFALGEARSKVLKGQVVFLDRLVEVIARIR